MKPLPLWAGAALLCPLPVAASAQAPAPSDVIVTATRTAQPLGEATASVSVLTAADLANSSSRTLDDGLRRVPGIDLPFATTGEQHPTDTIVSMRGLGGIRSLVLLDGVPIHDSFFGYVQWAQVPVGTVDRVEVVRGGGSALWGNYAMGGVIDILTNPIDRTALDAQAAGGSRDTWRVDGRGSVVVGTVGLGVDGGASRTGGYVEQADGYRGAVTVPTSFATRNVALSADWTASPTLSARVRTGWHDEDQNFLTRLQTNQQHDWRTTASLRWRPDTGDEVTATGFHVRERFVTNNTGAPDGADPLDAEYVQNRHDTRADEWGASLIATRRFAGALTAVTLGGDYRSVHGIDRAAIFDETGAYVRTDLGQGDQRFLGGFAQAELRPVAPLHLLFSLRYQDFRSFAGIDASPGGVGRVPARHDRDLDPRIAGRLNVGGGIGLRAAWYRAFRAPTLDNLYRSASVPGYILYANAALRPETLDGGEVGVDAVHGSLRLQATAYTNTVTDFLTYRYLDPATLPPGFAIGARLVNAGAARSRGVEAELRWTPSPRLNASIAYTYADSIVTRNPEDPASVGVGQPGVPRHRVLVAADWTGPRKVTLSPRLRYVGPTNGDPDDLFRTDAHVVVDLGASLPLDRRLSVFAQAENLFDARYVGTNDGFTAPLYGRPLTVTLGLRARLR